MAGHGSGRRLAASFLALILPSIGSVQLALHVRAAADTTRVWTDHTSGPLRAHDHEICLQLQRSSQTPAVSYPERVFAPVNPWPQPPPRQESPLHRDPLYEVQPRAPPAGS